MKIKMSLSPSSVRDAIRQLEEYRDSIPDKLERLTAELADEGVEIAKANVVSLDAEFTGELLGSIHSEKRMAEDDRVIFAIKADSSHAIYVEVGTGVVGASSPYPGKLPVMYAQGNSFTTLKQPFGKYPAGTYGWFYVRDGQLYFTEGMPSRPFMYNTGRELEKIVVEKAKKIFGTGGVSDD